jgi:hypothetical protein
MYLCIDFMLLCLVPSLAMMGAGPDDALLACSFACSFVFCVLCARGHIRYELGGLTYGVE